MAETAWHSEEWLVAVVDHVRSYRDGLCSVAVLTDGVDLVAVAEDLDDLPDEVLAGLDGLLLQAVVPGVDLTAALARMAATAPRCRVVVSVWCADDELVAWCRALGAHAVVSADEPLTALFDALLLDAGAERPAAPATATERAHAVAARLTVTPRELEVLWRLAAGDTPQHIAHDLGRSLDTVRDHLRSLRAKLSCATAVELVVEAHGLGLLPRMSQPRPLR